jgi:hypothetical protein
MKYVMFRVEGPGGPRLVPIIFPDALVHIDVAKALYGVVDGMPVSAGECNLMVTSTHGGSTTLNMHANEDDALVISAHDYLHGLLDE